MENKYPQIIAFVNYMLSFYGTNGLYPIAMTSTEALIGLSVRLLEYPHITFCGDTLDREKVRDIIGQWRDLKYTNNNGS